MPVQLNENEEYDVKYFKSKCPQLVNQEDEEYLQKNSDKAEDCLYLNVFTIVVSFDVDINVRL